MSEKPDENHLRTVGIHEPVTFALKPEATARTALASELGIRGIKKLSFAGEVHPTGAHDLTLSAVVGATVVQDCVVTGVPITTRIDAPVLRHYLADMPEPELSESEMPEDEYADPLPETIDLAEVMAEAVALALPDWPRAPDVDPIDLSVTEPGKTPMTDEDARPFAALKNLGNPPESTGEDGS